MNFPSIELFYKVLEQECSYNDRRWRILLLSPSDGIAELVVPIPKDPRWSRFDAAPLELTLNSAKIVSSSFATLTNFERGFGLKENDVRRKIRIETTNFIGGAL